jgi:hypothetical protein
VHLERVLLLRQLEDMKFLDENLLCRPPDLLIGDGERFARYRVIEGAIQHAIVSAGLKKKEKGLGWSRLLAEHGSKSVDSLASKLAGKLGKDWHRRITGLARQAELSRLGPELLYRLAAQGPANESEIQDLWLKAKGTPQFSTDLLDLVQVGLDLEPSGLWQGALRTRFLPQVPERLPLYRPETWERVASSFDAGAANDSDHYAAAWMLLHDLWLSATYPEPDNSPFADLAASTRNLDHPALRVAHCLRDLGYGGQDRVKELVEMVGTTDPAYRALFRDAMWID